ncbi:unnamed protein product [Lymnaea stagnalis]|uniref:Methyltransferase domain-containing protein n=1 Tax=Lymnaea stagnalis TaxID=6523 RepID=A0AAV2H5M0_LYMST
MRRCKCVCALLSFVGLGTVILLLRYSGQNWTELTVVPFQIQRVQQELKTTPATTTPPAIPDNPIPGDDVLKQMSHKDLQEFYHSYINSPQTTCNKVVRMGKITDGGWELCDDPLYRPIPGDCLVYSYGINFDFSFDTDMSKYGCTVHAFDPSMKTVPNIFGGNIYFHATGVAAKNGTINGPDATGIWQLHTVKEHRDQHHHSIGQRQLDILKMDVEGYEYESLMLALEDGSLSDVRQLAFETHVTFVSGDPTQEDYIKFLGLLRSVYHHGFRIYLTHRNYVWSSFDSSLNKGKKYAKCHEIHTVNINLKNGESKLLTSFRNNSFASEASRTAEHDLQAKIIAEEAAAYKALILQGSPGQV